MKQYILLAATALTLAACTNDEMTTATDGKVALKVNASIGTVDTRAVGTQWTTGDQIGLSTEEGTGTYYKNVCYVWDGSSFTTSPNNAIFFETSETVTFHAYYPYKGSADYTGVSTAADNQTTANQPKIDFLYASGATASKDKPTVNFTGDHAFTHRMSLVSKDAAGMRVVVGHHRLNGGIRDLLGIIPCMAFQGPAHTRTLL